LAEKEINEAGGVNGRPIQLLMRNEGSDPGEASISLDALLDRGVDAIVGPASSRIAANLLASTVHAAVPVCSPTATAIELDHFPDKDLFFRTVPSDSLQAMALGSAIVETGRSNVAVLYADDDYGSEFYESLRNGYVMQDGEVYGLVSVTMEGRHAHHCPMHCRIVATDVRGQKHEVTGTAIAVHPWYNYNPSHVAFQSLMQWRCGNRVGYSEMADIYGLEYLAERRALESAGERN